MTKFQFNSSSDRTEPASERIVNPEIRRRLAKLQRSHSQRYQLMHLETWAIIGTMDNFFPGFWSRFMSNRQAAFREFLEEQKAKRT